MLTTRWVALGIETITRCSRTLVKQKNKARAREKGGNKPMDMDKLATKDPALKHTSMKA
jgi:hypothetical protein